MTEATKQQSPTCYVCGSEDLTEANTVIETTIKGSKLSIEALALVCQNCGEPIMLDKHMDNLLQLVANEYQSKKSG